METATTQRTYLFGHTSEETAYEVKNYPYGGLRTSMFYWIETVAKKGDRFCSMTINPKNGRKNAPKKSTFSNVGIMFLNEKNHVSWVGLNIYSNVEQVTKFVDAIGGEEKLLPEQLKQVKQLKGEKIVVIDEFTGKAKKDFAVKWEKNATKTQLHELRITFDRTDGVAPKEIFEAMKTVDQDKLKQLYEGYEGSVMGHISGTVRIYVRNGVYLGTIDQDSYNEYLASDRNADNV